MHKKAIDDLVSVLHKFKNQLHLIDETSQIIKNSLDRGNKILTAGNGGSAADALHLVEEMVGRFDKERSAWPAVCLCGDPTLLTCIGNDYGFEHLFSRQIEGIGRPGDTLVVFSTSGNSINIINAIKVGRALGLKAIALLGKNGGTAKGLADCEIIVPSNVTARIQEVHTFILHSWLSQLECNI